MIDLSTYSGLVLSHGSLGAMLGEYKAPNFKIHSLLRESRLIGLKKGMYAVAPAQKGQLISKPLVANHLYGPSYVSLEYALFHYGLIPEHVAVVTSVSTKRGKTFDTPLGLFSYQQLPPNYYAVGVRYVKESETIAYMMASPEKALCDWLALTPNLRFYSSTGLMTLLLEDMRMDESLLCEMDLEQIEKMVSTGFRNVRLKHLIKSLEKIKQ